MCNRAYMWKYEEMVTWSASPKCFFYNDGCFLCSLFLSITPCDVFVAVKQQLIINFIVEKHAHMLLASKP